MNISHHLDCEVEGSAVWRVVIFVNKTFLCGVSELCIVVLSSSKCEQPKRVNCCPMPGVISFEHAILVVSPDFA